MSSPRRRLLAAALLLLGACAPATPARAPAPRVQVGEPQVRALATLLEIEDARDYRAAELERLAASPGPLVRQRTALALGRLRAPAGVPLLTRLLADPDSAVAATAAFALGQVGDTAAVPALLAALRAGAGTAGAEAALALGKLPTGAGRLALDSLLRAAPTEDTPAPSLVGAALLALWKFPRPLDAGAVARWLDARDPELRWRAAYALSRRPTAAAFPALRRVAGDPDPDVRALALRGLTAPLADSAGLGARATLPLLLAAAGDTSYPVRINAVRTLGTYPDPAAVQRLLAALAGPDPHLRLAAAESLGRLGAAAGAAGEELRHTALDPVEPVAVRQAALEALARVAGEGAVDALARAAADSLWRLRASAARGYASLRPLPRPELVRLVRDADPRVATLALLAATEAAGDSVAPLRSLLLESLGAADVMVRATALDALGRLRDPATLPALLDAYDRAQRDPQDDAALAAVTALGSLRDAGQAPGRAFFARFARSADYLVRLRARVAFGDSAARAWGAPLPVETGRSAADYRRLVTERVVPALRGERLPRARIETASGTIDLVLFAADAPITTENFLRLAAEGFFDAQEWPRVVPNFVVQGGDPRGDTNGGPGYSIRDELNRHPYGTGTLGMALSGPDTGGSQFFVTHSPQPHLDGGYTVFGEVAAGEEVAERILPGERIVRIRPLP